MIYLKSGSSVITIFHGEKSMEIYTIKQGVMKQVPEDYELKQMIKYILFTILGLMIGRFIGTI
jgi:fucose permease